MPDFLSMGEILIDLTPLNDAGDMRPNPGGAPANVACVMAQMGRDAAFAGKVGKDGFGRLCRETLNALGVDIEFLREAQGKPTSLAVVTLDAAGNLDFGFYRQDTADVNLSWEDIEDIDFDRVKIFHFGSLSLTAEPARGTVIEAARRARESGCVISYDPNLRLSLWPEAEAARAALTGMLPFADIVKISEEEGEFLFGETDPERLLHYLHAEYSISLPILTLAERGCVGLYRGEIFASPAFVVDVVDTTGAGDAFLGGFLHKFLELSGDLHDIPEGALEIMLTYGNAVGSLVTTRMGAIPAIPTLAQVAEIIDRNERIVV